MKRNYTFIPLLLLLIVAIVACSNNSSKSAADNDSEGDATKATVQVPQFSADSAYQYIQTQADFGPRVPNTAAHKACGEFLAKKLEEFGAKVYNQHADLVAYDNTILKRAMLSAPIIRKAKGVYCSVPIGTAVLMPTRMPTRRSITALSWV